MKQFLQGALATLIAGIALFLFQQYFESNNKASSLEYFTYKPSFFASSADLLAWERSFTDPKEVEALKKEGFAATAIVIRNNGTRSIQNQDVAVSSSFEEDRPIYGIISYQNDLVPGGSRLNTTMKLDSGILRINYKVLEPGEVHRFWIVTYRFSDIRLIARGPDLKSIGWDAKIYTSDDKQFLDFKWDILFLVVCSIIIGALLDSWITQKMLKRRGYDLLKIMSVAPNESEADTKKDG